MYILFQVSDSEIVFSQYAQDPYEGLSEMYPCEPEQCKQTKQTQTKKQRRREPLKKHKPTKSFVMSRLQRRGTKLIKITVIDLCNNSQTSDSDSESENVVISAQYIVKDAIDSVMDETESLVKKISKSLIDNDF